MNRHHTQAGFTLIWALLLGILLITIATSLIQSAAASNRAAAALTRGSLLDAQERNIRSYEQRLLEANVTRLVQQLPSPNAGSAALTSQLQASLDGWCTRDPDGKGTGRVRVYVSPSACGQALPSGVTLAAGRLNSLASGLTQLDLPYALADDLNSSGALPQGIIHAVYGPAPADLYALIVPGDFTFPSTLRVSGDAQVDGHLSFDQTPNISGVLSNANCGAVVPGCTGSLQVTSNGQSTGVMGLTPTPGHPGGLTGFLGLGQPAEKAGFSGTLSGFALTADTLILGVSNNIQTIQACQSGHCTLYLADAGGNVYQDATDNAPLLTNWNGVLSITSPLTTLTVQPANSTVASLLRPMSVATNVVAQVQGNLTFSQTTCTADLCNDNGSAAAFSLVAPSIHVLGNTTQVHGALIAPTVTIDGSLLVYGSVLGTPSSSGALTIQADPRVLNGLLPPLMPTLPSRWRLVNLTGKL